jgi:hypothetical protein
MVDICDDADSSNIPIRKMKALADVGLQETLSKERWTAVKWVLNQLRILCDNKYDISFEPKHNEPLVSHKAFYDMIRPAFWADAAEPDIKAIMKRAVIVVNTPEWVYVRPATEKYVEVQRIRMETYDFLKDECKDRLQACKDGEPMDNPQKAIDKKWEAAWVRNNFNKKFDPRIIIGGGAFDTEAPSTAVANDTPVAVPYLWPFDNVSEIEVNVWNERKQVKRERDIELEDKHLALAKQMKGNYINVEKHRIAEPVPREPVSDDIDWWLHDKVNAWKAAGGECIVVEESEPEDEDMFGYGAGGFDDA